MRTTFGDVLIFFRTIKLRHFTGLNPGFDQERKEQQFADVDCFLVGGPLTEEGCFDLVETIVARLVSPHD